MEQKNDNIKEFTPTPETAIDLERAILGVKHKKDAVIRKKMKIQIQLGDLRSEREKINPKSIKGVEITEKRKVLKTSMEYLEIDIADLKLEMDNKNMLLIEVNNYLRSNTSDDKFRQDVIKLKEKYLKFSSDNTRISSMRTMAAELCGELEKVLNK